MRNAEKRREILESGVFTDYMKQRRDLFSSGCINSAYDEDGKIIGEIFSLEQETAEECERCRKCIREQSKKIAVHIDYLLNRDDYDVFFLTATYTDEVMENTTHDTRWQKLRRTLKGICADYILNVDYGGETDREHAHGVIAFKKGDISTYPVTVSSHGKPLTVLLSPTLDEQYKMGFYSLERIGNTDISRKKIAKYIAKLTAHSLKVKQSYVSTMKGSDYQLMKQARARVEYWSEHRSPNHGEQMLKQARYDLRDILGLSWMNKQEDFIDTVHFFGMDDFFFPKDDHQNP